MDKIKLTGDDGEAIELYVMETTRLNGTDYYLVTEDVYGDEDEDGVAYIIKEVAAGEDAKEITFKYPKDQLYNFWLSDYHIPEVSKREEIKQKANNKESQESEVVFRFGLLS